MVTGNLSRYNSHQKRWNKIKNDPILLAEFKLKHKEYRKNARLKNLEAIQTKARLYHSEMAQIAKELGNCSSCYKEKAGDGYLTCKNCRDTQKRYYLHKKEKHANS